MRNASMLNFGDNLSFVPAIIFVVAHIFFAIANGSVVYRLTKFSIIMRSSRLGTLRRPSTIISALRYSDDDFSSMIFAPASLNWFTKYIRFMVAGIIRANW